MSGSWVRQALRGRRDRFDAEAWRRDIAHQGWLVVHVPDADPSPLHYTVGLTGHDLPELLTYGLNEDQGALILNDLAGRLVSRVPMPNPMVLDDLTDSPLGLQLWTVTARPLPVGHALRLYGSGVRCKQLVSPDAGDRLPWDAGYSDPVPQPLLFVPPTLRVRAGAGQEEPGQDQIDELLLAAVEQGVNAPSPGPVEPGERVVLAAGAHDAYASVIVLYRDPDPAEEPVLLDDTYFLGRDADGRWVPPGGSGGGANPEWILARPDSGADVPQWGGAELLPLGNQWGFVEGVWLTDLTVMASSRVSEVAIAYGDLRLRRPVPPNGVFTCPAALLGRGEAAVFEAYDQAGRLVGRRTHHPVSPEEDHPSRMSWP